jgi:hypothetical protein
MGNINVDLIKIKRLNQNTVLTTPLLEGEPAVIKDTSDVDPVYKLYVGTNGTTSGNKKIEGEPGPPNTLTIGDVSSGSSPDASITGTSPNQILNLVLQPGEDGRSPNRGFFNTVLDLEDLNIEDLSIGDFADIRETNTRWTWNISYIGDENNYDFIDSTEVLDWYSFPSENDFFYNSTTSTIWQYIYAGNDVWAFTDTYVPYPLANDPYVAFDGGGLPYWLDGNSGINEFDPEWNPSTVRWINTLFPIANEGPPGENGVVLVYEAIDGDDAILFLTNNKNYTFAFVPYEN